MLDAASMRFIGAQATRLSRDWLMEIPIKIHSSSRVFAVDGSPEWTPEFTRWIESNRHENGHRDRRGPYQNAPERKRTTTAMRKLRKVSQSEFNVCYDLVRLNPIQAPEITEEVLLRTFIGIASRLNTRAAQRGFPERYSPQDVAVLALSGIDKMSHWL